VDVTTYNKIHLMVVYKFPNCLAANTDT
jgi:hypothetical protein